MQYLFIYLLISCCVFSAYAAERHHTHAPTSSPTSSPTSPSGTIVMAGSGNSILDAGGNVWTITAGGQVAANGITDTTTGSVIELAYVAGILWQENSDEWWWGKTSPTAPWLPSSGTQTSPLSSTPTSAPTQAPTSAPTNAPTSAPGGTAPSDTVVMAGSGQSITDANGNVWTITGGAQVAVNGVTDTTTGKVVELVYVNDIVWQKNSDGWWWGKTSPTAPWSTGTQTNPLSPSSPSPSPTQPPSGDVPSPAASVGYNTRTFGPNIVVAKQTNSTSSFPEFTNGANWAPFTFFGTSWLNIGYTENSDGSLSMDGSGQSYGNGLCTAVAGQWGAESRLTFSGVAFGGGLYVEAVMKGDGPMSFWSNDIETMNGLSVNQGPHPWPGQDSSYGDWVEVDIGEFDSTAAYGISFHNWYGEVGSYDQSNSPFEGVFPNPTPDYTIYHKYGFLWVPATSDSNGYGTYYFDEQPVGTVTWNQYNPSLSPPPLPVEDVGPGSTYGVLDELHLAFILGGASGSTVTFESVSVWQTSSAHNIYGG